MRQQSVTANDAILRVMHSCMKVDVVYYDGQPVTIFCPDSAVHETLVPAPQIVSAEFVHSQQSLTVRSEPKRSTRTTRAAVKKQLDAPSQQNPDLSDCVIVQVCVTRKLPLSSAHANRFFRLGFLWTGHGVEHVLFTRAISVLAKQAPGAERKQKYFASHKAEPSRTCWILQRAASSRGMDLSKSFDSACAPAPMGVGGHKRARVVDASPQSNASFARTAAGECKVKRARRLPGQQLCAMRRTARVDAWDFDGAELCSPPSPGVPECPQALAVVGFESDDTAIDVRSVSPCQDDDDVSIVHEMWRLKAGAEAAAAGKRSCGDPLARFFKRGCSVPPPSAVPCHIPCVSRCASPLPTPHAFNAGDSSESDCAVPPRVTPHQAPVIATQAPNASQAVSTPDDDAHPFSPRSESVFQVPNPPSSMGQFVGLAAGLADMARQDSLERGHSLIGHEDHGSHGSLPFADLLALGPSQDASLPELARSYSARSGMSVGSGFNLGGQ